MVLYCLSILAFERKLLRTAKVYLWRKFSFEQQRLRGDFFRETCVAAVNNSTAFETRLQALGMKETNDIPSPPSSAPQ
jgi:hypothetical protein